MKTKIYLTVLLIGVIMGAIAQNPTLTLTFTAEDNGQYVPLDSIFIENLSQGCDTNLYPPDTVIVLDYITGIGYEPNTAVNRLFVSQNYANPFTYSTNVDLYIPGEQEVNVYVRDLVGRELSRLSLSLQKGTHSFTFYPGNENIYLLTISSERESQTIKMFNAGSGSAQSSQCKIVYNASHKTEYGLKDAKSVNGFTFNLGDLLRYTGYAVMLNSNPGSDTLEDSPSVSTLYEFEIIGEAVIPTVITDSVLNFSNFNALIRSEVTSDGGDSVSARGVCWSISPDPTLADDHTCDGSGTGIFESYIDSLAANTLYYVRSYATNSVGTAYGDDITFTTLEDPVLPTVTTDSATDITNTTATSGGNVLSDGGAYVIMRGVCWSTSPDPTIADNYTNNGMGTGTFISYITGLAGSTLYYVRAFATNSVGTAYGNEITFSTLPPELATVTTDTASNITDTTATSGGEVVSDGGSSVTERGVCWSTSPDPTTSDPHTVDGYGPGHFLSNITGLTHSTFYYVRAYATNSIGTAYGNEVTFITTTPFYCGDSIADIDGNLYETVQIGSQCWMKENLKTTTYNNGTPIPNVTDANAWSNLTTGAYVWYDNDISWKDSYGALYNWYTTVDANGLCPTGWHVPTHTEWVALTNFIGGTGAPHGNELKSCRQVGSPLGGGCNTSEHPRWSQHNTHFGTDDYGFSGLPGGYRHIYGPFNFVGDYGLWWSSTEISSSSAWYRFLSYCFGDVGVGNIYNKPYGFSVRCLRD